LSIPALASATKQVELYYNNIQIRLNGKTMIPKDAKGNAVEPFVIDGTTYLPVRAVGEALGLNVNYDGATSTVILGNDPEKGQPAKWLGEMETFKGTATEYKIEKDGQYTDKFIANNGDTYDRYYNTNDSYGGGSSATYLLKDQYSKFTGTFYLPKSDKDKSYRNRFLVYLDDKLTYTSPVITAGVEPQTFSVNVGGAYKMEVVGQYSDDDEWHSGNANYRSCSPIANAALWTN
ncbi:MAG: stalk domain-containing protein, partial [Oscillospiraceae bacterium]